MKKINIKNGLKKQLASSLAAEGQQLNTRMAKAEELFGVISSENKNTVRDVEKDEEHKIKILKKTFTIPEDEFELMDSLRKRVARNGVIVNKSEVLRSALIYLNKQDDKEIVNIIGSLRKLSSGRPAIK